jgi:hypothetical protein
MAVRPSLGPAPDGRGDTVNPLIHGLSPEIA